MYWLHKTGDFIVPIGNSLIGWFMIGDDNCGCYHRGISQYWNDQGKMTSVNIV